MDIFEAIIQLSNLLDSLNLCGVLSEEEIETSDAAIEALNEFIRNNVEVE